MTQNQLFLNLKKGAGQMRLLDEDTDKKINHVSVFLTRNEGMNLRNALTDLLDHPENHHDHVSSEDYQKEITIAIYDQENLKGFDQRSRKLILEDI